MLAWSGSIKKDFDRVRCTTSSRQCAGSSSTYSEDGRCMYTTTLKPGDWDKPLAIRRRAASSPPATGKIACVTMWSTVTCRLSPSPRQSSDRARGMGKNCSILAWAANAGNKKRRPTGAGRRNRNKVCSGWNKVREVVWVDEWSRLPSGRIDRGALAPPKPDRVRCSSAPFAEPRDADERAIAAIWANVLQLAAVGIDDDFLSLGGDSLTATVIAGRLSLHFATECSAARIFECGTIAVLALAIRISLEGDTLARLLTDVESLTPDEVERQLSARARPHMAGSGEICRRSKPCAHLRFGVCLSSSD